MTASRKVLTIVILLLLICGLDQATKYWAVNHLLGRPGVVYLNGLFQLVYAENPGAFLGLGGGLSREVRFVIFALIVFLGLGGMLWYIIRHHISKVNLFAYTFIIAGGCGNLWDRVFHEDGHVIDFMLIEVWGPLRTGVFNVADVFIVVGVLMALLGEYLFEKSKRRKAEPDLGPPPPPGST